MSSPPIRLSPPEQEVFDLCSLLELRAAHGLAFDFVRSEDAGGPSAKVGRHRIAVFWDGYHVYASEDGCPHADASLAKGSMGQGLVMCNSHHAIFDLKTGECLDKYATDLTVYKAELRDGRVIAHAPGERRIIRD